MDNLLKQLIRASSNINGVGISRQRLWQLKQKRLKRCETCGVKKRNGKQKCHIHLIAERQKNLARYYAKKVKV